MTDITGRRYGYGGRLFRGDHRWATSRKLTEAARAWAAGTSLPPILPDGAVGLDYAAARAVANALEIGWSAALLERLWRWRESER